jgi:Kef-type K+ transport system membrane component KefB
LPHYLEQAKGVGQRFSQAGLPSITGFIATGIVCGPQVLNIVEQHDLLSLTYINMFALAYITTSAGAELVIHELKPIIKSILVNTTTISLLVFGTCTGLAYGMSESSLLASVMEGMPGSCRSSISLVLASIMMARSPATAIAIVKELRCKGRTTTTFLGITVASDIYVLIAMSVTMSLTKSSCSGMPFKAASLGVVLSMIIVSMILGILVGGFFMLLMQTSRFHLARFIVFPAGFLIFLGAAFFSEAVAKSVDSSLQVVLEPLLMCIVGGFVCVNFSKYHHRFIDCLDVSAPYIMLPFFTLAGCGLDLITFAKTLPFALIICLCRGVCIFVATFASGTLLKEPKRQNLTIWMTLLAQGGFDLGLGAQVAATFPGWGDNFKAVIVACVIIHQIVGPITCRLALKWAGEAGVAQGQAEHVLEEAEGDPNAVHTAQLNKCAILGTTPTSKALALNLLTERWGVLMLTLDEDEALGLQADVQDWANYQRAEAEAYAQLHGLLAPIAPVVPLEDNFRAQAVADENGKHPFSSVAKKVGAEPGPAPECDENLETDEVYKDMDLQEVMLARNSSSSLLRTCSFETRCWPITEVLSSLQGLKVVVIALDDDLAALTLLDNIQDQLRKRQGTFEKMRFVVLMKELRWAEAFAVLDAIPIHDFVSNQKTVMLAATTEYKQDCIVVHSKDTQSPEDMSDAFLKLFDGPLLAKTAPSGKSLEDYSDTNAFECPSIKLLSVLQKRMQNRKTALTGGRMLRRLDEWIQKALPPTEPRSDLEAGNNNNNRPKSFGHFTATVFSSPSKRPLPPPEDSPSLTQFDLDYSLPAKSGTEEPVNLNLDHQSSDGERTGPEKTAHEPDKKSEVHCESSPRGLSTVPSLRRHFQLQPVPSLPAAEPPRPQRRIEFQQTIPRRSQDKDKSSQSDQKGSC